MSYVLIRRWLGLGLGAGVALGVWMGEGAAMTAAALLILAVVVVAERNVGRQAAAVAGRSRRDLVNALAAAMAWAAAASAALVAPVARALRDRHLSGGEILAGSAGHPHLLAPWGTVIDVLVAGALISSLLLARALRRREPLRGESSQAALDRARAIVSDHGEDSLSPYILRPDKQFIFSGNGAVAFAVVAETVVISADPVGPPEDAARALEMLVTRARRSGLAVAAYGVSVRHLDSFHRLGLRAIQAGEEAVVDPAGFTLEGRAVRKLRQSVRRIERLGWRIVIHEGREIDAALEAQIAAVEEQWRAQRTRIHGFAMSMGEFELAIRPDDVYVLAVSPDGQLQGVMRFLRHREKLSLDIVRRVGVVPNGLTEALVCHGLAHARAEGLGEVSLNYAGLAHLLRPGAPGGRLAKALMRRLAARLEGRFQMDRLVLFNEKFGPVWRPRYLIVDSRHGMPRAILRVLQVEGYLRRRSDAPRVRERWELSASTALGRSVHR